MDPIWNLSLIDSPMTGARRTVSSLFRPGFEYSNGEVHLLNLEQPGAFAEDLLAHWQPAPSQIRLDLGGGYRVYDSPPVLIL